MALHGTRIQPPARLGRKDEKKHRRQERSVNMEGSEQPGLDIELKNQW